ncbi:hypothetical protein EYM_07180 [Ignicoccus islandicus DSM 13165]|uniref:Anaphase-promoting complex subunit 4 WD40 domain-containing protein n=1 Tax=Ignicoccus islandicus DSM 13165 TaxID=940295 RepID=A0A0U2U9S3_9CREN|nr:hypothetical protein [Ignicoccus islandicus]ALU12756.1 hypothetical protein EYM_07180 [Ignicoccus islandicus DSM 13165]
MKRALLMSLILITTLLAFNLKELWVTELCNEWPSKIVLSENDVVGVACGSCFYMLDSDGNLIMRKCVAGYVDDISYSNGTFAVLSAGNVLLYNEDGVLIQKLNLGWQFSGGIYLHNNTIIACGSKCGKFDLDGNADWETNIDGYVISVSASNDYVYAINIEKDRLEILSLKDGSIVSEISSHDDFYEVDSCNNLVAVIGSSGMYVYKVGDNGRARKVGEIEGFVNDAAFSPNCKYIAVASPSSLELFLPNGDMVYSKSSFTISSIKYISSITNVDWKNDKMALSLSSYSDDQEKYYVGLYSLKGVDDNSGNANSLGSLKDLLKKLHIPMVPLLAPPLLSILRKRSTRA